MKIPEVLFVKHCPNLSPERKIFLSKHINNRVPIDDVRWVEDYNHTDTFVWWLNKKLNLPYGVKLTSNMVKSIMMFCHIQTKREIGKKFLKMLKLKILLENYLRIKI